MTMDQPAHTGPPAPSRAAADEDSTARGEGSVLHRWEARKVQPIVILYVVGVFLGFVILAHFVFHSTEAVKALVLACIGSVIPLVPTVMTKTEWRLTEAGLEKGVGKGEGPRTFKAVFSWDELSHVVPRKHGFKYYKPLGEAGPLRRFWRVHVLEGFSGEFQVEAQDRGEVLAILEEHRIPTSKVLKP